jgi:hypothetical protein
MACNSALLVTLQRCGAQWIGPWAVDGPVCRVGVELSKVEVRFNNLEVSANVNIGSRGMPTVANAFINTPLVSSSRGSWGQGHSRFMQFSAGVSGQLQVGCAGWVRWQPVRTV